jgi:hypothetical protein
LLLFPNRKAVARAAPAQGVTAVKIRPLYRHAGSALQGGGLTHAQAASAGHETAAEEPFPRRGHYPGQVGDTE